MTLTVAIRRRRLRVEVSHSPRRAVLFAIALVLAVFSALPHQHDDLIDVSQKTVERIGACDAPAARHMHAARVVQAQPCAACLRQHAPAALQLVPLFDVRLRAIATVAVGATDPRSAVVLLTSSRGPPA